MLNASVGVQRAIGRLRRPSGSQVTSVLTLAVSRLAEVYPERRLQAAAARSRGAWRPGARINSVAGRDSAPRPAHQARISLIARVGHERTVALVAAAILLSASAIGISAGSPVAAIGNTSDTGSEVRLTVGGGVDRVGKITEAEPPPDWLAIEGLEANRIGSSEATGSVAGLRSVGGVAPEGVAGAAGAAAAEAAVAPAVAQVSSPYLDDGTLLKPVAVRTTVADGSGLIETYKVKAGDTLTGIASKFGVSMMTLWWANSLTSKDDLRLGQVLKIPPVSGLVLTVKTSDTLAGLAARFNVDEADILAANQLTDPNLVVGQVLAIPGAIGKGIPVPKPQPRAASSGGGGGNSVRPPVNYSGGAFRWPVVGGGNYISQYYHYGHYGLDIAADYGSTVRSTAEGTVVFAGWKGNGGGYQVWVAHGSGLYTTYNHMSAVSVGSGQAVSAGQRVGRVGSSGWATGPHLHLEVWVGLPHQGTPVNPLKYL